MVNSRTSDMIVIAGGFFFWSVHSCEEKPLLRKRVTAKNGDCKVLSRHRGRKILPGDCKILYIYKALWIFLPG